MERLFPIRKEGAKKEAAGITRQPRESLVAPTGFEPATSALRGRRPKPLDDGAMQLPAAKKWLGWKESNPHIRHQKPLSCH